MGAWTGGNCSKRTCSGGTWSVGTINGETCSEGVWSGATCTEGVLSERTWSEVNVEKLGVGNFVSREKDILIK